MRLIATVNVLVRPILQNKGKKTNFLYGPFSSRCIFFVTSIFSFEIYPRAILVCNKKTIASCLDSHPSYLYKASKIRRMSSGTFRLTLAIDSPFIIYMSLVYNANVYQTYDISFLYGCETYDHSGLNGPTKSSKRDAGH